MSDTIETPETEPVVETDLEPQTDPEPAPDEEVEPETFPRDYVEKLRKESAGYRVRAQQADNLAARLHLALVADTGRLADPSDLAFDPAHLDDDSALSAALDDLLHRTPHLASRRPRGDVGQGISGPSTATDLAGILRSRA